FKNPDRIARLIKEVRSRVEKVFLKGRTKSQLTPAEQHVINAILRTNVLSPADDLFCKEQCDLGGMAYNYDGNVCLCPRLEECSDEFLLSVIGHEMGHSGDICNFDETGLKPGEHPFETPGPSGSVLQCLEAQGVPTATEADRKTIEMNLAMEDGFADWLY